MTLKMVKNYRGVNKDIKRVITLAMERATAKSMDWKTARNPKAIKDRFNLDMAIIKRLKRASGG